MKKTFNPMWVLVFVVGLAVVAVAGVTAYMLATMPTEAKLQDTTCAPCSCICESREISK